GLDLSLAPVGDVGQKRQDDRRSMLGGRRLEGLRTDHQADVQQDWQDGYQWDDRQQQPRQAKPTHDGYADAGGQSVADASADGFPAGVADIDGRREGATQKRADDRADAIGQQDATQ